MLFLILFGLGSETCEVIPINQSQVGFTAQLVDLKRLIPPSFYPGVFVCKALKDFNIKMHQRPQIRCAKCNTDHLNVVKIRTQCQDNQVDIVVSFSFSLA